MSGICPECGIHYDQLGRHWTGSCSPTLDERIEEVITGLVMGDGTILNRDHTPYLQVGMKADSYPYIEYLSDGMGPLASTVRQRDEMAYLITHAHPGFERWASWYDPHKRFPDDLELTPLMAKHWYVGDGGVVDGQTGDSTQIQFYTRNEDDRLDYLAQLFEDNGFETRTENHDNSSARVIIKDGKGALRWMGEPLPSFEYKWDL